MIGDTFSNLPFQEGGDNGRPNFMQMNGRCPVCNQAFDFSKLHVLLEQNGASLLHITCQNCHTSTLANVVLGQGGLNFSGIVTDLNITDVFKFKDAEPVNSEFVVELHSQLASNELKF
ncbi:MAG: hypothetical protein ACXQS8_04530 [Candidatus Helarchaeales archaeon]